MNKKKVLFVINGFGMGNATRCDALAQMLSESYQIDILTSDKAFEYFSKNRPNYSVLKQNDINLKNQYKFGSFMFYVKYIPYFFYRIFKNFSIQDKILQKNTYQFVVFDSDYCFAIHKILNPRLKIVGLNNAFEIVQYFYKNPLSFKIKYLFSSVIEFFDLFVYLLFCNFIICPCISYEKLKNTNTFFKKIRPIPLLIRGNLFSPATTEVQSEILIIASSSGVHSSIKSLNASGFSSGNTSKKEDFILDNTNLVKHAKIIICNAGQSSIAECLYLNKKSFLIPIPRHAEQYINSLLATEMGALVLDETVPAEQLETVIKAKLYEYTSTAFYPLSYNDSKDLILKEIQLIQDLT